MKCAQWITSVEGENPFSRVRFGTQTAFNDASAVAIVGVLDVFSIKGKFVFKMVHIVCRRGKSKVKAIHMEWQFHTFLAKCSKSENSLCSKMRYIQITLRASL